jgi:peptide/nickel transport system permease protein
MQSFITQRPWAAGALFVLALLYGIAILAPLLAPYPPSVQNLQKTYHPPTKIFWQQGSWRVQLYENSDPSAALYRPLAGQSTPLHFWVAGSAYNLFGFIPLNRHLFGVDAAERVYLLGSDETGRDVFSRLVYGSQVSLSIGLIGITLSMSMGLVVGGLAGYFGGLWDSLAMRASELLLAIPGLYLLLALRSALATHFSSEQMYILITVILSFIGWAGTARVVRGLVLSLRERPFIGAAQVLGVGFWTMLRRHLLPNMAGYLLVAATLSIPGFILGEAALSFLGIGIQEPSASWGLMLTQAQQMKVPMLGFWWLLTPGLAIFITVMAFNILGDALRDMVDPKFKLVGR